MGLTRLADITGLDRIGIPTVVGHRPDAPTLSTSGGKGFTTMAAMVSAGMEAVEVWHAENVRSEVLLESHACLDRRGLTVPEHQLPLTSTSLFDRHRVEPWVMGWDLIAQRSVAVPLAVVSMGNTDHFPTRRWMPFAAGSNGLAGGNHLLEAVAAALYEVIERDAIACSRMHDGGLAERVDPGSIADPLVRSLLDRFDAADVSAYLFDCTIDTRVPTYMSVVADRRDPAMGLYRGYGAHLDPSIAMIRALTEAAQARLLLIAGSRDDYFGRDQRMNLSMSDERRGSFDAVPATAPADRHDNAATTSFHGDIAVLLARLTDARTGLGHRRRPDRPQPADPGRPRGGTRSRGLHVRLLPPRPARYRTRPTGGSRPVTSILSGGATTKAHRANAQRVFSPEHTLERVRDRFPAIGLTRLADITGLDSLGIPVILSVRPQAGYLSVDGGKGFTGAAARASAAMECFERHAGENTPLEAFSSPYADLDPSVQIPLEDLARSRNSLFAPQLPERWVLADDLLGGPRVAVPTVQVGLERHKHLLSSRLPFAFSSNGLNSGNTKSEALVGALYEVIERDATTCTKLAWEAGAPMRRVDLTTTTSQDVVALVERAQDVGVEIVVLDCTVDTQVPTFTAYLCDVGNPGIGLYHGYGTHLDPQVALIRAICEAAQGRLVYIAGSRDDSFGHHRRFRRTFTKAHETLLDRPASVDLGNYPDASGATFEADGRTLLNRLQSIGIPRVLAVDMTHPDIGVDVYRVVVPGLEGYMLEDFTPGRRARLWARATDNQEVALT